MAAKDMLARVSWSRFFLHGSIRMLFLRCSPCAIRADWAPTEAIATKSLSRREITPRAWKSEDQYRPERLEDAENFTRGGPGATWSGF
jgi:hypothetical protein